MGGIGSGSYYRSNTTTTLEEMQRIEVNALKQYGYFDGYGRSGTWSWTCGGEPSGSVSLRSSSSELIVSGRRQSYGEDWESFEQRIKLITTPCNFGGERHWFQCPYCFKRVGVLALGNDLFACRHCYRLPYASQNESRADRISRAQRKIADRIFDDEELQTKRKGIHWKTYHRLLDKYVRLDDEWNYDLLRYCQKRGLISEAQIFQDYFDYKERFG